MVLDAQFASLAEFSGREVREEGVDEAGGDYFDVGVAEEFETFVGTMNFGAGGAAVDSLVDER